MIILLTAIWFNIPYSPLREEFNKDRDKYFKATRNSSENDTYNEEEFKDLPEVLRKYIKKTGIYGKRKKDTIEVFFKNVDFKMGPDKPSMKLDYLLLDKTDSPQRIAFLDGSLFLVKFQGYDAYFKERTHMKGQVAKLFNVFNVTSEELKKGTILTWMSEMVLMPQSFLMKGVTLKEIDEKNVEVTIEYDGIKTSGVMTFNENNEIEKFYSEDRTNLDMNGKAKNIPWIVQMSKYGVKNGIYMPTRIEALWDYGTEKFKYFDGQVDYIKLH